MTWTQWKRNRRRCTRQLHHHHAMRPPRMACSRLVRSPISRPWTSTLPRQPRHTNLPHKVINSSQNSGHAGCVRALMTASVNSTISSLSTHRPSRTAHSIHNLRSSQRSLTQQRMPARRRCHFRLHRRRLITHQRSLWLYHCPDVHRGRGRRSCSSFKLLLLPLRQVRVQLM